MEDSQRLIQWLTEKETFDLPDWNTLPQLELYMDQVILLLEQYLGRRTGEKALTASTINNYVRMKVMPPPVKKKYGRTHLAYLIMICLLKQSLSISSIQRLLPGDPTEMEGLYSAFVAQYRTVSRDFLRQIRALPARETGPEVTAAAILSHLSADLTEYLLSEEGQ